MVFLLCLLLHALRHYDDVKVFNTLDICMGGASATEVKCMDSCQLMISKEKEV